MGTRAHRGRSRAPRGEGGFTLVELMVALAIIGGVLVAMAYLMVGALGAYASARQRSGVNEVGNAMVESLRARPYDTVGVLSSDPNTYTTYQGRDAVVVPTGAPPAVEVINPPAESAPVPVTVRRWVTWTDAAGGTAHDLKRLDVELSWKDNGGSTRRLALTSLLYPGGQGAGPPSPSANNNPVASFDVSPATPTVGVGTTFTSTSTDPDGDPLTYAWTFPDGSTATTSTAGHTFTSPGSFTVTLQVADGRGGLGLRSRVITVNDSNSPPTAAFTVDTPILGRPDVVVVDAATSSDPDPGDTLSYLWSWGDGSPGTTGQTAGHRYLTTGTFTITLRVTDSGGLTNTTTRSHTVSLVGCTIISGSFNNPPGNSTANEIDVFNNGSKAGEPRDFPIRFNAVTTAACTTLTAHLPKISGTFVATLSVSSVSGTKTWTTTANMSATDRFNLGTAQTGSFKSPANTGSDDSFPFAFSVV